MPINLTQEQMAIFKWIIESLTTSLHKLGIYTSEPTWNSHSYHIMYNSIFIGYNGNYYISHNASRPYWTKIDIDLNDPNCMLKHTKQITKHL